MKSENTEREPKEDRPEWLRSLKSCPSTNTWALTHFTDLRHGDVVFTRQQTAGRGQHGRVWYAPTGVLTASIVLKGISAADLPGLSLAAGLAVVYTVEDLLPGLQDMLSLKWPNDVLIYGRKLAGILCEVTHGNKANSTLKSLSSQPQRSARQSDASSLKLRPLTEVAPQVGTAHAVGSGCARKAQAQISNIQLVVGIGLNVCADFTEAGVDTHSVINAVSLHQVSTFVPDELPLLERLRHYLLQAAVLFCLKNDCSSNGLSALLPTLRQRDALLGSQVTLDLQGEQFSGEAAGIDECGRLLLLLPDGKLRAFASGTILKGAENKGTCNER